MHDQPVPADLYEEILHFTESLVYECGLVAQDLPHGGEERTAMRRRERRAMARLQAGPDGLARARRADVVADLDWLAEEWSYGLPRMNEEDAESYTAAAARLDRLRVRLAGEPA